MPRLRPLPWQKLVCVFEQIGYKHAGQKGSHIKDGKAGLVRYITSAALHLAAGHLPLTTDNGFGRSSRGCKGAAESGTYERRHDVHLLPETKHPKQRRVMLKRFRRQASFAINPRTVQKNPHEKWRIYAHQRTVTD